MIYFRDHQSLFIDLLFQSHLFLIYKNQSIAPPVHSTQTLHHFQFAFRNQFLGIKLKSFILILSLNFTHCIFRSRYQLFGQELVELDQVINAQQYPYFIFC